MAVPSGYTPLAKIGIVDKGTYSASATYNKLDFVYYNGSTWLAQKDGLKGVTPAEGANWRYLAKGFLNENAANININDTSNIMGAGAGKATTLQKWGDKVADWLVNKVITNDNFVSKLTARLVNNGTTTNTGFALDARYGKTLTDSVNTLNRKTLAGNVRGNENSGKITIDGVAWYYKDIKFSERFNGWPIVSVGYISNVDAQYGKERCFATNVSETGFRLIFENASGNSYYNWIASKQFN